MDSPGERLVKFAKGEVLFSQNELTRDLYIIKSGNVRIFKNEGSNQIELDNVGPGMVVGEVASIDGGPRTATGIATQDTEAVIIPADEFQNILSKVPDYFKKIALILVQRLREVDERINQSIEGDRTRQVAAMISLMAYSDYCVPCEEGFEINLKFIEDELVNFVNIPLSEIDQILEKLAKQNLIRVDRSRITLEKREALNTVAERVFNHSNTSPAT